jgi:predicted KAP-like P-loop ATPase
MVYTYLDTEVITQKSRALEQQIKEFSLKWWYKRTSILRYDDTVLKMFFQTQALLEKGSLAHLQSYWL